MLLALLSSITDWRNVRPLNMKKKVLKFKYNSETEIPQDVIDNAPRTGPFDAYAEYLLSTYSVQVSLKDSINYLDMAGCWDESELQDLDINKARLLWVAVLNCAEEGTNYFYMGC